MRVLVVAVCVVACGGGGNNSSPHNVTVDVVGPGSVSSTPVGIDCPSASCTASFTDHVTLFAQPDNGAMFTGWSGGCSGMNQSCTLELGSDQHATAMFQTGGGGNQTLSVSVTGPGSVTAMNIDCPANACSSSYLGGTMVTLTAMPQVGATFNGWSGDCTGTGTCTVTMDQMRSVNAEFAAQGGMHTLSVTVNGIGTVTSTPSGINCSSGTCTAMFASSQTVVLQEQAGGGTFTGWTGDCNGTGGCSVTMGIDHAVTASFGSSGYVLTVHLAGDGIGTVVSNPAGINCTSGSSAGCSYDFGMSSGQISLTATPAPGSSYAGQGNNGNTGCNGDNFGNGCSYGLNGSGVTVNVGFSGWTGQFPFPASLTGLALSGSTFLAVGGGGNTVTSTNDAAGGHGTYWTGHAAPPALNAVAVLGNMFYAASDGGHVMASPTGLAWTDYAAGTNDLLGIAASGTVAVAVGKNGAVEYSANGTTWNAATSGVTQQLNDVVYAGSQFIAIGYAGTIVTSPDGLTWTTRTSGSTSILYGVAYSGSQYVIVGAGGVVLTSPDGVTWTKPATSGLPIAAIHGIAWSGTTFVAAGDPSGGGSNTTIAYTSTNGVSWTAHPSAMLNDPAVRVAAPGDGKLYLLGSSGSLQQSSDGASWALVLAPGGRGAPGQGQSNALSSIAYNGSLWVAGGGWGSIFTSPDAVTWTSRRAAPCCDNITGIEWGAGLATPVFAAVGGGGTSTNMYILTSPDGITWTKVYPTSGVIQGYPSGIAYGGSTKGFAAVGSYNNGTAYLGVAVTSPDGVTWSTSATAGTDINSSLVGVTYGNGLFVADGLTLGAQGALYTSPDGASWAAQALTASSGLGAVAYGNGTYAALEPQGSAVWTSANGTTWTRTALGFMPGSAMPFGNGVFYDSALYTSTNGSTFTQVSPLPDIQEINGGVFTAAAYGNGLWVGTNLNEAFVTHH